MHIVIMGCGRVGSSLAISLENLGHSVCVIDNNPEAFRRLGEGFSGGQIVGIGFDRETLEAADIAHADAFAAVSNGDNSNIIAARVVRETFGVSRVVARIYDPKRAEVYERLGIPTVATVPWTANRLLKRILGDATTEEWRDPSGAVALVQVSPHESWVGHRLSEFESLTYGRVALVTRFGVGELAAATSLIQAGDVLHVLVTDEHVQQMRELALHGSQPGSRGGKQGASA